MYSPRDVGLSAGAHTFFVNMNIVDLLLYIYLYIYYQSVFYNPYAFKLCFANTIDTN